MSRKKRTIEISGYPAETIVMGSRATIYEPEVVRTTSVVCRVKRISQTEVKFETRNTKYTLHILPAKPRNKETLA